MIPIHIESVSKGVCRNNGVGDYWYDENGTQQVKITEMNNEDYEFLVAMHELVESFLCRRRSISEESITEFDAGFEKTRHDHPDIIGDQEPGHMISAPYHKEHVFAEKLEKLLAEELNVDWKEYEKVIYEL